MVPDPFIVSSSNFKQVERAAQHQRARSRTIPGGARVTRSRTHFRARTHAREQRKRSRTDHMHPHALTTLPADIKKYPR